MTDRPVPLKKLILTLREAADFLENGEAVIYEFDYSTCLNEGKIRFVIGLQDAKLAEDCHD